MLKALKNIFKMNNPIVTISTGTLRGKIGTNIKKGQYFSFQGIPYAKPPIGDLRFKAPLPAQSWLDIRDATHEGSDCIHKNPVLKTLQGSEDCLTLNVYTPNLSVGNNLKGKPVMVWIHGGGFTSGSGSTELYGPEFLMTEDIVLVTINYRTGILGFLSLEDPDLDIPGNAGLKDMVMALKWVQENIDQFCGDPNNVTIFGESAGGAACHYLILSQMAKGLFHKAILQSGCALNVWATGRRLGTEIANILGIQSTNEKKILEVLKSLTVKELYKATEQIPDPFIACVVRPHGPVIERKSPGAFLSENPIDIIKSGKYNHVPIIVGYTNREGILTEVFQKPKPFKPITNFEKAVPHFLKIQPGSDMSKLVAKEIQEFYFGNEKPSLNNKDKSYMLDTDNFFLRELILATELHVQTSSKPIFFYRISVETELNMMKKIFAIDEPGVCHADDLGYLFKNMLTPKIKSGSVEEIALLRFVQLWTNFAKLGNPNPAVQDNDSTVNVRWKPVTEKELNFLDIGTTLNTGINPEAERMAFWKYILKVNPLNKL